MSSLTSPSRAGREVLTAARTYYVRSDGSDANNGLANTAGGAFLTLQKAVDTVAALDLSIYNANISAGAGTFASAVLKPTVGAGSASISGAGSTTIVTGAATAFAGSGVMNWTLSNMKLASTGQDAVQAFFGANILLGAGIEFGAVSRYHVNANFGSLVYLQNNYTISGGGSVHWNADNGSRILAAGITITLTGTPAFSGQFAYGGNQSLLRVNANTFTGGATGSRYQVENNATIYTGGAGVNYLPGNAAGAGTNPSAAPYGLYN